MTSHPHCWNTLKPVIDQLTQLIISAPGDEADRKMLALLATSHFFGVAASVVQRCEPEIDGMSADELTCFIMSKIMAMQDELGLKQTN